MGDFEFKWEKGGKHWETIYVFQDIYNSLIRQYIRRHHRRRRTPRMIFFIKIVYSIYICTTTTDSYTYRYTRSRPNRRRRAERGTTVSIIVIIHLGLFPVEHRWMDREPSTLPRSIGLWHYVRRKSWKGMKKEKSTGARETEKERP